MGISWLSKGSQSEEIAKREQAAAAARKEQQGKLFRFWLKKGEEAQITFIDGILTNGLLLPPRFYEHAINVNGRTLTFVCPEQSNPGGGDKCPFCEASDRPALVSLFTIIDHRSFKSSDGNKTYKDTPKLLVAKPTSMEYLQKRAEKFGGLAGVTFDVSRIGDKSASIGSMFDFVRKEENLDILKARYTRTYKDEKGNEVVKSIFVPADYEKEITFHTGDELRAMGYGKASTTGGVSGFSSSGGQDSYKAATMDVPMDADIGFEVDGPTQYEQFL